MPANKHFKPLLPLDSYDLSDGDRQWAAANEGLGMLPVRHPLLSQACAAVSANQVISPNIQHVMQRLLAIAAGKQASDSKDKKRGMLVGLAAPQIGEPYRIVVVDVKAKPEGKRRGRLECFINPEIIWRSRETAEGREGCFSTGPVWGLVRRSIAVKIRALTPEGRVTERIFEGFPARIVQHEIDHLNGIRFPERIRGDKKRHWVHAEERPAYLKHIAYWPRTCTLSQWTACKQAVQPPGQTA